jgi:hypothetical protein
MAHLDSRVDTYIANAEPFARPILERLRNLVHAGCPEVNETIKWSMPVFEFQGILCFMAAFQRHCAFGFRHGEAVVGVTGKELEAMGQFGRLVSVNDLPPAKALRQWVRQAAALNASGARPTRPRRVAAVKVPQDFAAALLGNAMARATFERFSPSHQRAYVEWISEARRAETRARRMATALEWLAAGKRQNWRYERPQAG